MTITEPMPEALAAALAALGPTPPDMRWSHERAAPLCCIEDGCDRPAVSKDRCTRHARQFFRATQRARTGEPPPQRVKRGGPCNEPGCTEPAFTRHKCRRHYQQWWRASLRAEIAETRAERERAAAADRARRRAALWQPGQAPDLLPVELAVLRAVWAAVPQTGAPLERVADRCNLSCTLALRALRTLEADYGHVAFDGALWLAVLPLGRQKERV